MQAELRVILEEAAARGDLVMVDTDVLLAATNTARTDHEASRCVFSRAPAEGIHLATCGQVLREYLVVATRPVAVNGLGLGAPDALKNLAWFRKRMVYFEELEAVHRKLVALIESTGVSGKRVHDANIVAVMQLFGIRYLVTNNPEDFSSLPGIDVVAPGEFCNRWTDVDFANAADAGARN